MEITSSKNNNIKNYIVFFDLDRTITKAVSGRALARAAFRKKLMSRSDLVNALYVSIVHRLNLMDPVKLIDKMVRWVKGIPEKILSDLCSDVVNKALLPSVHPEVKPEIKFHKERNAKVVILSSSLVPICREIAAYLEIDDIICSDLEVIDGSCTGRTTGPVCFGKEKVVRLKEYCERNNHSLEKTWYYGDSISDLPALSIVGNPVCINPDRKLLRIARRKGWRINYWT
jgi:putative phosphoserine phosphatase/1-acylglycerol-3-phosphate O-acyltransferase